MTNEAQQSRCNHQPVHQSILSIGGDPLFVEHQTHLKDSEEISPVCEIHAGLTGRVDDHLEVVKHEFSGMRPRFTLGGHST